MNAEAPGRYKAWCATVIGPAIEEEIERISQWHEDEEYGRYRFRQHQELVRRRKESESRNMREQLSQVKKPTSPPPSRPQQRAFRHAAPYSLSRAWQKVTKEDAPRQQPKAFSLARPFSLAQAFQMELEKEEPPKQKPRAFRFASRRCSLAESWWRISSDDDSNVPAFRREAVPVVNNDEHLDNATFLSHHDWEHRLAEAESRRKERQQAVQHEKEHSTGILDTFKGWATGLWSKIKETFWG